MTLQAPSHLVGRFLPGDRDRAEARKAWILLKRRQGHSCQEIADAIGLSLHRVYGLTRARWKAERQSRHDQFTGRKFLETLSPDIRKWMRKECPKGIGLEQFVASIVTDAHAEETDAGNV